MQPAPTIDAQSSALPQLALSCFARRRTIAYFNPSEVRTFYISLVLRLEAANVCLSVPAACQQLPPVSLRQTVPDMVQQSLVK